MKSLLSAARAKLLNLPEEVVNSCANALSAKVTSSSWKDHIHLIMMKAALIVLGGFCFGVICCESGAVHRFIRDSIIDKKSNVDGQLQQVLQQAAKVF